MLALASPAAALTCADYGDYVVCENGRSYVAPEAVGRYLTLPRHPTPSPTPDGAARRDAPIDLRTFRRALGAYEQEAERVCRQRFAFDSDRRAFCIREETGNQVRATNDRVFIDWWASGAR